MLTKKYNQLRNDDKERITTRAQMKRIHKKRDKKTPATDALLLLLANKRLNRRIHQPKVFWSHCNNWFLLHNIINYFRERRS